MTVILNERSKLVFMVQDGKITQYYEIEVKGVDEVKLYKLGREVKDEG